MRALFITVVIFGICSCIRAPRFDLRQPIYLVADQSFWSGCKEDPAGNAACRARRFQQTKEGINQWFDYFDKDARPLAVIVSSKNGLPIKRVNEAIYLKVLRSRDNDNYAARYSWGWNSSSGFSPEIVFDDSSEITSRTVAHEFGHALGRDDNDVPEGSYSVMSYKMPTNVLRRDVKMMCRLHRECRMEKRKRKN